MRAPVFPPPLGRGIKIGLPVQRQTGAPPILFRQLPMVFDAEGLAGDHHDAAHGVGLRNPLDHRLNERFTQNIGLALHNLAILRRPK